MVGIVHSWMHETAMNAVELEGSPNPMDYQSELTHRTRASLWRALAQRKAELTDDAHSERMELIASAQGKRPDQIAYSIWVLAGILVLLALAGFAVGAVAVAHAFGWMK